MTCSLFLFEKDGASYAGNNNVSDSHTTVDWLFPKRERQEHGKSGEGIFTISRESGVPHITEGQIINLHHLFECPEAWQYCIYVAYLLRK